MKASEFLADLQEAIPRITPRNVKAFLILVAIFLGCVALFATLFYFLPPIEEFKKFGYLGVFLANLLPSLSVVVPVHFFFPGQALSVVVAAVGSPLWVAVVASLGSTLGEITAYYLGYGGQSFFNLERFQRYKTAESWMRRYGWFAVFIFAFLPLFIFDFVGIAAGALRLSLSKFLFFCYLGRLPRAIIEVYFYTWVFQNIISHLPHWMSGPFSG